MGYPRIDDARRAGIVAAVRDPAGRSRAQIAREFGCSPRTVQRIADEAGVVAPWDTTGTRAATAAARDHLRARRAAMSARFLDEAERLLDKLRAPYVVHAFGGRDNEFNSATLTEPDAAALRNLVTSAAVLFDKHIVADKHDADGTDDAAGEVLDRLFAGLESAYTAIRQRPAGDEGDEGDDNADRP